MECSDLTDRPSLATPEAEEHNEDTQSAEGSGIPRGYDLGPRRRVYVRFGVEGYGWTKAESSPLRSPLIANPKQLPTAYVISFGAKVSRFRYGMMTAEEGVATSRT